MAVWKLVRVPHWEYEEEHELVSGKEYTLGRGRSNNIICVSGHISREHCVISVGQTGVQIKDLKSSNGTYVNGIQIQSNSLTPVAEEQTIALGTTDDASVTQDAKFIFQLVKDTDYSSQSNHNNSTLVLPTNKSAAQDNVIILEDDDDDIFSNLESLHKGTPIKEINVEIKKEPSTDVIPELVSRVLFDDDDEDNIFDLKHENDFDLDDEPIVVDSDSESERWLSRLSQGSPGKPLLDSQKLTTKLEEKSDDEYSSDIVCLRGDTTDEENDILLLPEIPSATENSFAGRINSCRTPDLTDGIDDNIFDSITDKRDYEKNEVANVDLDKNEVANVDHHKNEVADVDHDKNEVDNVDHYMDVTPSTSKSKDDTSEDEAFEITKTKQAKERSRITIIPATPLKKTRGSNIKKSEKKVLSHILTRATNEEKKQKIEERKAKLKALAEKRKFEDLQDAENKNDNIKKQKVVAKVSNKSRGDCLATAVTEKPVSRHLVEKRKEKRPERQRSKSSDQKINEDKLNTTSDRRNSHEPTRPQTKELPVIDEKLLEYNTNTTSDRRNSHEPVTPQTKIIQEFPVIDGKLLDYGTKHSKIKTNQDISNATSDRLNSHEPVRPQTKIIQDVPVIDEKLVEYGTKHYKKRQIKTYLTDRSESIGHGHTTPANISPNKENSTAAAVVVKKKKSVSFANVLEEVRNYEVEPGSRLRPTKEAKLKDVKPGAVLSFEKRFLMNVLKWTPKWIEEQKLMAKPPPILPHNTPPVHMCQAFQNHAHYMHVISDLLLIEVWENVTQGYNKRYPDRSTKLRLTLESLPPFVGDESFGPSNFSVNLSLPMSQPYLLPRVGDLMLIEYGTQEKKSNFVYVHNIRNLAAPPNNVNNFYSISLNGRTSEKMLSLKIGETLIGTSLYFLKNELVLVEAMDALGYSPLAQHILKPEPHHFPKFNIPVNSIKRCKWTEHLNENQFEAVESSVSAALGDKPSIQMIQGPPGTGKSAVICATVMRCLFDQNGARRYLANKILVCATSNAAVDEVLIRLLQIRQNLPSKDRFRMVRVGREEAMHPDARNISLHTLAKREISRQQADTCVNIDHEEAARLEAKVNSWTLATQSVLDPARRACCEEKLHYYKKRLNQARGGAPIEHGVSESEVEKIILLGADIIITTLSSAGSQKLKILNHRVALCIIDEAGQAIEPVTLVPLILQVTKLTLVGDPQQLPGYLSSQRAKQHGLAESLFSRLAANMEDWPENPIIFLNTQYRMHPEIADYPNRAFYGGKLQNAQSCAIQRDLPFSNYKMLFVSSGDRGQDVEGANVLEAWASTRIFLAISNLAPHLSRALVTPYAAHRQCLLRCLAQANQTQEDYSKQVHTLDSFQGQERDVIVISIARSNGLGFLTHAGRLNVLLTRAKQSLFICLNPDSVASNRIWKTLLDDAGKRKATKHLPKNFCQPVLSSLFIDCIRRYLD